MASGGWSIEIPGELAERWEERGAWVGWDGRRSIWLSTLEAQDSIDTDQTLEGLPQPEGEGDMLALEHGGMRALAGFTDSVVDDRPLITMHAIAAFRSHAAIGTIVLERSADREWALATWASLTHLEDRE